jgi:hypothetical protein
MVGDCVADYEGPSLEPELSEPTLHELVPPPIEFFLAPRGVGQKMVQRITEKTKFLVAEVKEDTIVLKKIDVETMAKRLEADLKDVDLTAIFKKVRDEANEKVRRAYPEIFT